jgi:Protein of unknown function (DUF2934)
MPEKAKPPRRRTTKAETTPIAKTTTRTRKPKASLSPALETIAFHAYLLWERGEPGDASEHWLRAERELAAA